MRSAGCDQQFVYDARRPGAGFVVLLDRLAEFSRHPAGCVEAHGRSANQPCQVRLKVLKLGGADLPMLREGPDIRALAKTPGLRVPVLAVGAGGGPLTARPTAHGAAG